MRQFDLINIFRRFRCFTASRIAGNGRYKNLWKKATALMVIINKINIYNLIPFSKHFATASVKVVYVEPGTECREHVSLSRSRIMAHKRCRHVSY